MFARAFLLPLINDVLTGYWYFSISSKLVATCSSRKIWPIFSLFLIFTGVKYEKLGQYWSYCTWKSAITNALDACALSLVIDFKAIRFLFEVVIFNHYLSLFAFNLILCNDWIDGGMLPITVEWSKLLNIRLLYFLRFLLRTLKLETLIAVFFMSIVLARVNFFLQLMWAFSTSCSFFSCEVHN